MYNFDSSEMLWHKLHADSEQQSCITYYNHSNLSVADDVHYTCVCMTACQKRKRGVGGGGVTVVNEWMIALSPANHNDYLRTDEWMNCHTETFYLEPMFYHKQLTKLSPFTSTRLFLHTKRSKCSLNLHWKGELIQPSSFCSNFPQPHNLESGQGQ